jgi:hypothetical protein
MNYLKIQNQSTLAPLVLLILFISGCSASNESLYQVKDSGLLVIDRPLLTPHLFYWLDNHRIIVQTNGKRVGEPSIDQYHKVGLKVWDVSINKYKDVIAPVVADLAYLCLSDKLVTFGTTNWDNKNPQRYFYKAELDQNKQIKNIQPNSQIGELNQFTCRLKSENPLPEWAKNIPQRNIVHLRPQDGFVWIDRDLDSFGNPLYKGAQVGKSGWPRAVRLYRPGESKVQGIDLPIITQEGRNFTNTYGFEPMYYKFKDAYYFNSWSSNNFYWLYPTGKVDIAWQVQKGDFDKVKMTVGAEFTPTKVGLITRLFDYIQVEKIKHGGLLKVDGHGEFSYITKGRIGQSFQVSPDGCSVAFLNDDRKYIDGRHPMLFHKLQVVNLCAKEK